MADKGMARGRRGGEPSMKEQIQASGETEQDPLRLALGEDKVDHKFLGREFLTWLLYHADEENGGGWFKIEDDGEFRLRPGERILLRAIGDGAGEIAARGAAPAQTADVRYSIAGGLTVREADLIIERGDLVWQLAVTADMFDVKRAKLPPLANEEEPHRSEERLQLIDQMESMLREAYRTFLKVRLLPSWSRKEVPLIREWLARSIKEDGEGDDAALHARPAPWRGEERRA